MNRRVIVAATAGVVALVVAGCSSGSPHATTATTSPPSTAPPSTRPQRAATTTTAPQPTPAGCAPEARNDRPDPFGIDGGWIQMVSPTRGYAVVGRSVVGTADGRHWTVLYRAPAPLSYVDAPDPDHVWATGPRLLVVSSDAGRSWTVEPAQTPLRKPHFVNARLGWAIAAGSLLRSTDGGKSWVAQRSPCPVDGVCFDSAQNGWLATHSAAYVTTDGGAHWVRALDSRDPNATNGVALDIQCSPANSGWVLFGGGNGAAGHQAYVGYRCPAAGRCAIVVRNNFMAPAVPGTDGPGASPGPFSVIDDHTAAFVGYTGPVAVPISIMIVGDDGRARGAVHSVKDPSPPPPATPVSVSFASATSGWLLDSTQTEAHILATTDGGRTWAVQYRAPVS